MGKCLQVERAIPLWLQRLVLGVRLHPAVDQLQHAERVALAVEVGRQQVLGAMDWI